MAEPSLNIMQDKLLKIKAFAFDVDGVFTDGGILATSDGDLLRMFDAKDSFAVRMASMNGVRPAIITGASSQSVVTRCKFIGIEEKDIFMHSRNKLKDFHQFCANYGYSPDEVLYCGDDLPDIPVLRECFGVAPADAVEEVKKVAAYVSPFPGGHGCIRNIVETVLKLQNKWNFDIEQYAKEY